MPLTGTGGLLQHTFSVPIGSNTRMFTRLKVMSPWLGGGQASAPDDGSGRPALMFVTGWFPENFVNAAATPDYLRIAYQSAAINGPSSGVMSIFCNSATS